MSLIKFNSDSRHYYDCFDCGTDGTLAIIRGITEYPSNLQGGFGVFEYSDIEETKPRLFRDLSDYSLVWEIGEDTLTFSNDKRTYYTYFIYDENGFITSETTGTEEIAENAILEDSGIGREHQEYEHIELLDDDGFYLYKVVDGKKVDTTVEDKEEWAKQYLYSIYYVYNDENYVSQAVAILSEEDIPAENYVFVREEFSKNGVPAIEDVLFDEDGFYNYKVVEGTVFETTAEDKEAWREAEAAKALAAAKEAKEKEISDACAAAIVGGVDVNGSHFNYATTDQNNLYNAMNLAIQTGLSIPYHAESENCRLYTKEELVAIYVAAESNATGQITYNNQMRQYIESLTDIEDVNKVAYGDELTGQYLETYNAMMAQAEEVIKRVIGEN